MTQVPRGGEGRGSEATILGLQGAESRPTPPGPLTNHLAQKSPALAAGCGEPSPGPSAHAAGQGDPTVQ